MPTRYSRIAVTKDPELAAALEQAAPYLPGKRGAALVRELALRGAETVVREEEERKAAIERLIDMSVNRKLLDWDVLERIDQLAWGMPERNEEDEYE